MQSIWQTLQGVSRTLTSDVLPFCIATAFALTAVKRELDNDYRAVCFVLTFLLSLTLLLLKLITLVGSHGILLGSWYLLRFLFHVLCRIPFAFARRMQNHVFSKIVLWVSLFHAIVGVTYWFVINFRFWQFFAAALEFLNALWNFILDWPRLALEAEVWMQSWVVYPLVSLARDWIAWEHTLILERPVVAFLVLCTTSTALFVLYAISTMAVPFVKDMLSSIARQAELIANDIGLPAYARTVTQFVRDLGEEPGAAG